MGKVGSCWPGLCVPCIYHSDSWKLRFSWSALLQGWRPPFRWLFPSWAAGVQIKRILWCTVENVLKPKSQRGRRRGARSTELLLPWDNRTKKMTGKWGWKRHYDFCYDRFLWVVLANPGAKNFNFCDGKSKTSEKIKTFSWKAHLAEFTFSFSKSGNASMSFLILSSSHISLFQVGLSMGCSYCLHSYAYADA